MVLGSEAWLGPGAGEAGGVPVVYEIHLVNCQG